MSFFDRFEKNYKKFYMMLYVASVGGTFSLVGQFLQVAMKYNLGHMFFIIVAVIWVILTWQLLIRPNKWDNEKKRQVTNFWVIGTITLISYYILFLIQTFINVPLLSNFIIIVYSLTILFMLYYFIKFLQ